MEFDFPPVTGTGLEALLPNAPKDLLTLLKGLLTYDPEERMTAEQALRSEYFRECYEAEKTRDFHSSL